ncbi:hypothetical protein EDD85DRAFT_507702 [Armillaria nabsnona]|nr:hypothetical protein EDD85DRAFT_507702 [Armillaria nabsnona]
MEYIYQQTSGHRTSHALLRFVFEDPNFDPAEEFLSIFEGRVHLGDLMNIRMLNIGIGITATMSTVVADFTMIWRCWMVWGRRWLIVLLPILCLVTRFVFKIVEITEAYLHMVERVFCLMGYISCILAMTLWCTVLIVVRILIVIRAKNRADGGLGEYRDVMEVFVESSALHSVTLIIFVALEARSYYAGDYFNTLAAITTGVAPTLLAGRVASGHARPDDSWRGSIISSLRFEAHPQADPNTYSEEDSMVNLEVQPGQADKSEEIDAEKKIKRA